MALSTYDIAAEQGSDYATTVTYTDDNGSPVNLAGYTCKMQVRTSAGAATPVLTFSNGNGMTITAAALATVPAGSYKYDLEIVSGAGAVTKLLGGDFDVAAEVTR